MIIDTDDIQEGDELDLDLAEGKLRDLTTGNEYDFPPLPKSMSMILADGGLAEHVKKHGGLSLE